MFSELCIYRSKYYSSMIRIILSILLYLLINKAINNLYNLLTVLSCTLILNDLLKNY